MPHVTLTASAADELAREPAVRAWEENKSGGKVPLLFYYHRCHFKLDDGTVVEHGDGFGVSLVDSSQLKGMDEDEVAFENVALPDGRRLFVRVPKSMLGTDLSIGWSKGQFTLETPTP